MVGFYFKFKYSPKLTWSDRSQSNDCFGGSQGHSEKQTVLDLDPSGCPTGMYTWTSASSSTLKR